jgi:hypothetical protein
MTVNPLKNKRGSSYFTPVVVILIIAMILSVVLYYATTKSTIETTRDNTKRVLDSYVMKNSIDIYNSIKQGNDFTEDIENYFYVSSVLEELSLDFSGSYLYTVDANGDIVYRMTNPNVTYKVDNTLKLQASYDLQMPVWFAGQIIYWFTVPVTVSSSLTLK